MRRRLFGIALAILPVLVAGCGDFNIETERTGGPVMNEGQQAADAFDAAPANAEPAAPPVGNVEPADASANNGEPQPGAMPVPPAPGPANQPIEQPGEQSGSIIGKKTKEVLNAKELADDPNWTVAADNPAAVRTGSIPGTAYNRAAALSGSVNLESWVKLEQAQSGEWPTYDQLIEYIEKNPTNMPSLKPGLHYAYDETTGKVVILEEK